MTTQELAAFAHDHIKRVDSFMLGPLYEITRHSAIPFHWIPGEVLVGRDNHHIVPGIMLYYYTATPSQEEGFYLYQYDPDSLWRSVPLSYTTILLPNLFPMLPSGNSYVDSPIAYDHERFSGDKEYHLATNGDFHLHCHGGTVVLYSLTRARKTFCADPSIERRIVLTVPMFTNLKAAVENIRHMLNEDELRSVRRGKDTKEGPVQCPIA